MFCSCKISTDKCLVQSLCNSRASCVIPIHVTTYAERLTKIGRVSHNNSSFCTHVIYNYTFFCSKHNTYIIPVLILRAYIIKSTNIISICQTWSSVSDDIAIGLWSIFTTRRYAKRSTCRRRVSILPSVCVCVCVCVCVSVTLR